MMTKTSAQKAKHPRQIVLATPNCCCMDSHDELGGACVRQRVTFEEIDSQSFSMTLHQEIDCQPDFEKTTVIEKPFHWRAIVDAYRADCSQYEQSYPLELRTNRVEGFERWQIWLMRYLLGAAKVFWSTIEDDDDYVRQYAVNDLFEAFLHKLNEEQLAGAINYLLAKKNPSRAAIQLRELFQGFGNEQIEFNGKTFAEIFQLAEKNKANCLEQKKRQAWVEEKEADFRYLTELHQCKEMLESAKKGEAAFSEAIPHLAKLKQWDCRPLMRYFIFANQPLAQSWAMSMVRHLTSRFKYAESHPRKFGWPNIELGEVRKDIEFWEEVFDGVAGEDFQKIGK